MFFKFQWQQQTVKILNNLTTTQFTIETFANSLCVFYDFIKCIDR